MSTLNVTEFSGDFDDAGLRRLAYFEMPYEPAVSTNVVTFTGTPGSSSTFNTNTQFVRLMSDADCHILFGSDPTATTSKEKFQADVEYFRGVTAGQKLSVIAA